MKKTGDVRLSGKQPETFKKCLKFLYHCEDARKLDMDKMLHVMQYLHYYEVEESLKICVDLCIRNDICKTYAWVIDFQMDESQRLCERKISVDCAEIFKTDTFLQSPFHLIDRIVSLETLMCDENEILSAVLQWARFQCEQNRKDSNIVRNLYNQLTNGGVNLLHRIRYGELRAMSLNDFAARMNLSVLFETSDEHEDVMHLLDGRNNLQTGKFTAQPRKIRIWPSTLSEINLNNNRPIKLCGNCSMFPIHLTVSKTILWYEFEMVKIDPIVLIHEFTYEVVVEEVSTSRRLHTQTINGNANVKFTKPVLLQSNTEYAVLFEFTTQKWVSLDAVPLGDQKFKRDGAQLDVAVKLTDGLIKSIKFTTLDHFLSA